MSTTNAFLSGAFVVAAATVSPLLPALLARTGDRLFAVLALAFALFGIERLVLVWVPAALEGRHLIYLVRLAAYGAIIAGIVDKSRSAVPGRARRPSRREEPRGRVVLTPPEQTAE